MIHISEKQNGSHQGSEETLALGLATGLAWYSEEEVPMRMTKKPIRLLGMVFQIDK